MSCWYRDPEHQPAVGWCPRSCNGPVLFSERAGNGDQLVYCEAHAYWRRKTIGLPLVRRMSPDEQLAQAAALDDDPTLAAAT
ncbi:MAG TPA: hypothetical protein VGO78_14225 [Acidimicrobiales bacterium]|nr:hypothetical protein [Acidimicrobiales bacterium]